MGPRGRCLPLLPGHLRSSDLRFSFLAPPPGALLSNRPIQLPLPPRRGREPWGTNIPSAHIKGHCPLAGWTWGRVPLLRVSPSSRHGLTQPACHITALYKRRNSLPSWASLRPGDQTTEGFPWLIRGKAQTRAKSPHSQEIRVSPSVFLQR